jgi:uncharacterized protein YqgC (DUF456 family)
MIFDVSPSFLTAMIGYVSGLFSDFLPFFVLIFGLFLGFFILAEIVEVGKMKKEEKGLKEAVEKLSKLQEEDEELLRELNL